MAGFKQTNVRVLPVVRDALAAAAADMGESREEAARRLLRFHLDLQMDVEPDKRYSHITTVLRYPPLPIGRRRYYPDELVRVSLRLPPSDTDLAAATQLIVPGQTARRAHRDYVTRPMTDALVTAVERKRHIEVEGLEGLPPVIRHKAAVGLWRLVYAATFTRAELRVMWGTDGQTGAEPEARDETTPVLRAGDFAWHHPWRTAMALHFARKLLMGPDAQANMQMLFDQGDGFEALRYDLERSGGTEHEMLDGRPVNWHGSTDGRGGSAVWRLRRSRTLDDLARWLTDPSRPSATQTDPPGWALCAPTGWPINVVDGDVSPAQAADVEAGRVLAVPHENKTAILGLDSTGKPHAGFAVALTTWSRFEPARKAELVLMDEHQPTSVVWLLAPHAFQLGLIDRAVRDKLVSTATAKTRQRINEALDQARRDGPERFAELDALKSRPEAFERVAHRVSEPFSIARPWWEWTVGSFIDGLHKHSRHPARVTALADAHSRYAQYQLERDSEEAARRAVRGETEAVDDFGGHIGMTLGDLLDEPL